MTKRAIAKGFLIFFILLGGFCLPVFGQSLWLDWRARELELFELAARLLGYGFVLAVDGLSALSAYSLVKHGAAGRWAGAALRLALLTTVLLSAHDLLLYQTYGNQLEGTFTMAAFFAMDAALLALYAAAVYRYQKRPGRAALPVTLGLIALIWLCYMAGDMAGYPAARLTDWDEALMKLPLMAGAGFLGCLDFRT